MKTLHDTLIFVGDNSNKNYSAQLSLSHISIDSRFMHSQWLFIAYQGILSNGNDYIASAIHNGASAVFTDKYEIAQQKLSVPIFYILDLKQKISALASWFYDNPSQHVQVTAVTGTNGKTSISHLYAQLATLLGVRAATLGTIGNGIWPKLDKSTHTTPDSVSLQRLLNDYKKQLAKQVIIEASSHALAQGRLTALHIECAIWTNLSHDHLDYHGNMEAYFQAKTKLFEYDSLQSAIINLDDTYAHPLIELFKKNKNANLFTYSLFNPEADLYVSNSQPTKKGYAAELHYKNERYNIQSPLLGQFNLYNLAATILALIANGFKPQDIMNMIPKLKPIIGRMQQLNHNHFTPVVIDYAHTPDALKNALLTARAHVKNKLWCIFGCGGDRDTSKRAKMAEVVEKFSDQIIVTEDNNRMENFKNILADIQKGFHNLNQHTTISDRTEAIHFAIEHANADDLILLCGKGHERYMDKNGEKTDYNEEEIIKTYWKKLR